MATLGAIAIVSVRSTSKTSQTPLATLPSASTTSHPTRQQLEANYGQPTADFPRVDRVQVKKMTFNDIWPLVQKITGTKRTVGLPPADTIVYVVARGGSSHPEANGFNSAVSHSYGWDLTVVDGTSGVPFVHFGYPDGKAWPTAFDQLSDVPGD
jgi:hypothetical protein